MFTPIIVPIMVEDDKCPECGRDEERAEVCKHCGYKYESTVCSLWGWVSAMLIVIFLFWILLTLVVWAVEASFGPASLTNILSSQFQWFCNLRV